MWTPIDYLKILIVYLILARSFIWKFYALQPMAIFMIFPSRTEPGVNAIKNTTRTTRVISLSLGILSVECRHCHRVQVFNSPPDYNTCLFIHIYSIPSNINSSHLESFQSLNYLFNLLSNWKILSSDVGKMLLPS